MFFREIFYNQINNANGGLSMEKHQVLTVLVADDEPELLGAVCQLIDWESLGFRLVGRDGIPVRPRLLRLFLRSGRGESGAGAGQAR